MKWNLSPAPQSLVILAALSMPLIAQETYITTRIATQPPGAVFTVDGTYFTGSAVLTWPKGSKHVVAIEMVQTSFDGGFRYTFGAWADPSGLLSPTSANVQVITADPAVSSLIAKVTVEYRVILNFFNAGLVPPGGSAATPVCGAPSSTQTPVPTQPNAPPGGFGAGLLYVNGVCYASNAQFFLPAGATLQLNAFPYDGFVFLGWSGSLNGSDAYLRNSVLTGPMTLVARFSPARKVTVYTDPPMLQLLIDRTIISTMQPGGNIQPNISTGVFQWAEDSVHVLAAPSPQLDLNGRKWIFDSWDFGGGQNALYQVTGPIPTPATITGKFVPGGTVSFLTNPVGLKLSIDGRDNWPGPGYNFDWALGAKHTVTAPAENTDTRGRKYIFKGWSNGGGATQNVAIDSQDGLRITANYENLNRVTVSGSTPGLKVRIEGADCLLPCVLDRTASTQVRIAAPAAISMGEGARLDFAGWSDGGSPDRVVSFAVESLNIALSYQTMYQMKVSSDPAGGAAIQVSPASVDGFYSPDTQVSVAATAAPGYRFRRWGGDLTTVSSTVVIDMGAPRILKAMLDKTPYLAPLGVRNAAGETPEPGVAPGSIVSIIGASLADRYEAGPQNPLSQSIGGVTVRVEGRLLPLLFVSPEQINAQVPSGLPEGSYKVFVKSGFQAEISANMIVTRNAPGLFSKAFDGQQLAVAAHEDGSAVSIESPARRGEIVTLFGTGFGPYDRSYPDGFPVPVSMQLLVADAVEVLAGDLTFTPAWTGAAEGLVGTTGTRLKISDEIPSARQLELRVRIQGKDSNKVWLPVE